MKAVKYIPPLRAGFEDRQKWKCLIEKTGSMDVVALRSGRKLIPIWMKDLYIKGVRMRKTKRSIQRLNE